MYHSLKTNLLILGFCGLSLASQSIDAQTHLKNDDKPQYKINLNLPSNWEMVKQGENKHAITYFPKSSEKIETNQIINIVFRPTKTSLKTSAQTLLDSTAEYTCQHKDTKILAEDKNTITFAISLDQCTNVPVPSSYQISKIFDAPDGQYMILYVADPKLKTTIKKMQEIIQASTITPIS